MKRKNFLSRKQSLFLLTTGVFRSAIEVAVVGVKAATEVTRSLKDDLSGVRTKRWRFVTGTGNLAFKSRHGFLEELESD